MKIETKYDIGQEVWCMFCGIPEKRAIVSITSRIYRKGNITDYIVEIREDLDNWKLEIIVCNHENRNQVQNRSEGVV